MAGDAFDLVHTPKQIKTALQRADGLAAKVDDIIDIQHKPIAVLVDAQTKRSPSWARELADKSYAELHQLADGGSHKAAQMRKLIDQQPRFQQRNYSR